MTMAVVLICHGYNPKMVKGSHSREVVWIFPADEVDEFAEDLIEEFVQGGTRVEPRRFARELRVVRQDLYRFLGIGDRPPGVPIRRSA
jgi:hypothetical protein